MRQTALDTVTELARRDPRVVFIGSDLGVGTMDKFRAEMPDRFFMEGVAEQNIVGMAAGLAMEGFIPFVNTIATFLTRRCFEQVAVDLCLHNLPVRLIANGGGVVYAPLGPTHLAIEDMAILRALPNMTVIAPSDAQEMRRAVTATLDRPGPVYIRLGKGGDPVIARDDENFAIGKAILKRAPGQIGMISTGVLTERCLRAADRLAAQGIEAGVLHCHTVKPLDIDAVRGFAQGLRLLVTVEEHVATGGLGSAVADCLLAAGGSLPPILRLALPDAFPRHYGSQDDLLEIAGLQPGPIAERIAKTITDLRP
ncbi:MAG TPA: transketolase C-terminal domain-containing protein [Stellaceae bacterium]|nr:transketolase C-terminal domain-containing protein [Stellaceae bacterium]